MTAKARVSRDQNHLITFFLISAFWPFGLFLAFWLLFLVVRPPLFGLGKGPITPPPGPAMVVLDRKDLN